MKTTCDCVYCMYWLHSWSGGGYCELVGQCPFVGAELQRGFMVAHYLADKHKSAVYWIEREERGIEAIESIQSELARVKAEVPCDWSEDVPPLDYTAIICHGGSRYALTEDEHARFEMEPLGGVCPACHGTGKKYPEGT
jgi:hypothetical protein